MRLLKCETLPTLVIILYFITCPTYLQIFYYFLVHNATKSNEFLSDKEKYLSQKNICSPPSSQQHCSPYYIKPPSRCRSHSESLNGSNSGKFLTRQIALAGSSHRFSAAPTLFPFCVLFHEPFSFFLIHLFFIGFFYFISCIEDRQHPLSAIFA